MRHNASQFEKEKIVEYKEDYKTEIYETSAGYVACAVNRTNDFVAASTKPLATQNEAKGTITTMLTTRREQWSRQLY